MKVSPEARQLANQIITHGHPEGNKTETYLVSYALTIGITVDEAIAQIEEHGMPTGSTVAERVLGLDKLVKERIANPDADAEDDAEDDDPDPTPAAKKKATKKKVAKKPEKKATKKPKGANHGPGAVDAPTGAIGNSTVNEEQKPDEQSDQSAEGSAN